MSEIIASVYEQMEKTGLHEGILFLDEINCVSETLMPAILQMLQNKTFGVHSLPEGWLIVAAGNPPRYNQSARSFDMATLDRVRCIELEPSLAAWQPYAAAGGVHPAVLSYLRLHPEHFFLCRGVRHGPRLGGAFCAFACLRGAGLSLHARADAAISARAGGGRRLCRVL